MTSSGKRIIWQFPWQYKESIVIVGGIALVGFFLQFLLGPFHFYLLQAPVNLMLGGILILLPIVLSFVRHTHFYRWFSGVPMAVSLISGLVILGIIMGLTPQSVSPDPADRTLFNRLGFKQMTSSWPFILIYFLTLLSLGMLIVRRLINFQKKDYGFYLNHIGLWILFLAGGLGNADMRRYVMHVREGETEWRVYNENKDVLDLPIAIKLNDFYMEEYPPKLAIIHRETGNAQPESKPVYFQLDENRPEGEIDRWIIQINEYIHDAVRNSDSTYQEAHMPGSAPAVMVKIQDTQTGKISEGWVCAGNIAQLYMVLNLDDSYCAVLTQAEPKRFISDIEIYTEDGTQAQTLLEVNKPFKHGNWMLYQYGYDNDAGKMSTYSSIELVYDPWIIPAYIGIAFLAAGSISMLWIGNKKRKEEKNDLE